MDYNNITDLIIISILIWIAMSFVLVNNNTKIFVFIYHLFTYGDYTCNIFYWEKIVEID